mgnify:CR=1 FL=1
MKKLLLILLCLPLIGFTQKNITSNISMKDLYHFLEDIPVGQEQMFGFNNRQEIYKSELGTPYEIFTLSDSFFLDEKIDVSKKYVKSTGVWRIPIIIDDKYRSLVTVVMENNSWKIVSIGARGLAEELAEFERNQTSLKHFNILRVFQIKGDFILTSSNIVYPLTSANNSLLFEDTGSNELNDVLIIIKNTLINYEK